MHEPEKLVYIEQFESRGYEARTTNQNAQPQQKTTTNKQQ